MASAQSGTRKEDRKAYWAFSLPAFILYLFVFAFPIILSAIISVSNYKGGQMFGGEAWKITGLQQYGILFADPAFWLALKNNIYIVLISVLGQLPLGFVFAYLIYRKVVKFGDFWEGILYMPAIISVIVLGIMWKFIFASNGLLADFFSYGNTRHLAAIIDSALTAGGGTLSDEGIKHILSAMDPSIVGLLGGDPVAGFKEQLLPGANPTIANVTAFIADMKNYAPKWTPDFMTKQDSAMIPIMFVTLWCWTGMYIILFHANMEKIDSEIIEAARIDGATEMQIAGKIVLPALSGIIINAAILCIAGSMNQFSLIFAMTGGGPMNVTEVLSIYMYRTATIGVNYPLSNSIAMVIIVISFILIGLTKLAERGLGGKE
jgi:ABC-type sugar transport systems, permease components